MREKLLQIVSAILAVVLVLALAGCSKPETSAASGEQPAAVTTTDVDDDATNAADESGGLKVGDKKADGTVILFETRKEAYEFCKPMLTRNLPTESYSIYADEDILSCVFFIAGLKDEIEQNSELWQSLKASHNELVKSAYDIASQNVEDNIQIVAAMSDSSDPNTILYVCINGEDATDTYKARS